MRVSTVRRSVLARVGLAGAALVAAGAVAVPAQAATATQQVAAVVQNGQIVVSGTGWTTTAGTAGSIIGIKLDEGGVDRTFELTYPKASTAEATFKARTSIWGAVQASATGAWTARLPYPTSTNSSTNLSGWTVGSTHSVRLLSGSLLTGDTVRTQKLDFTIGSTSATATTLTSAGVRQAYGSTAKLAVTVSSGASGTVSVLAGLTTATATLSKGKATLVVPAKALALGSHKVLVSYGGSSTLRPTSSAIAVTVVRATPKLTVKAAAARTKRGQVATFTVTATATGVTPSGTVTVKTAGKSASGKLSKGRATIRIRIPGNASAGAKAVAATYAGDGYVTSAKASTRITVTK